MIHEFTTSAAPSPYPRVSTSKTLLCHITLSHSHTRYPAITPQSNPPPFRTEAPISKIYPSIAPSTIPSSHPTNSSYPTHTNYSSPQLPPPPLLKSTPHPIRPNKRHENSFRQRKRHHEFLWSASKSALNLQSKQLYVLGPYYYYCLRLVLGVLLMR